MDKKAKIKNILIFIIGFGVGMVFAFQTVIKELMKYNML